MPYLLQHQSFTRCDAFMAYRQPKMVHLINNRFMPGRKFDDVGTATRYLWLKVSMDTVIRYQMYQRM
jgi:hypothetical protein